MSIHEMLQPGEARLKRFVPDYRINLIAPILLPDEDFEKFSTDFREVMQYIKYSRDVQKLEQAVEGNARFASINRSAAELINLATNSQIQLSEEGEKVNMCEAIRQLKENHQAIGRKEGRAEGRAEGREEGKVLMLDTLVRTHVLSLEEAVDAIGMTKEEFLKAVAEMKKNEQNN